MGMHAAGKRTGGKEQGRKSKRTETGVHKRTLQGQEYNGGMRQAPAGGGGYGYSWYWVPTGEVRCWLGEGQAKE
jgi:hypothetical protein